MQKKLILLHNFLFQDIVKRLIKTCGKVGKIHAQTCIEKGKSWKLMTSQIFSLERITERERRRASCAASNFFVLHHILLDCSLGKLIQRKISIKFKAEKIGKNHLKLFKSIL